MKYKILCSVSGGVTGNRQAHLKENGRIWSTSDRDEAVRKAAQLNSAMNNAYSTARFSYVVIGEH
jgi:hypothetical protein